MQAAIEKTYFQLWIWADDDDEPNIMETNKNLHTDLKLFRTATLRHRSAPNFSVSTEPYVKRGTIVICIGR